MARNDPRAGEYLLYGLIAGHGALYHRNPEFRAVITSIVRLLPAVVDTIAKDIEDADRREQMIEVLKQTFTQDENGRYYRFEVPPWDGTNA